MNRYITKAVLAIMILILVLWTNGCKNRDTAESENVKSSSVSSFQTAEELISQAEERARAEVSSAREVSYEAIQGTYECKMEGVEPEYTPTLTLQSDGTAFFQANLLAGMGEIDGVYTVKGNALYLSVTEVGFVGYTGDDVTEMVFDILEDGSLKLSYLVPDTIIGMTSAGNIFERKQD